MHSFPFASTNAAWLDTLQQSQLTPWIGGILLFFVAITLLKMVAKFIGRIIVLAVVAICGFLGWNWWDQPQPRAFSDISQDWFATVKNTDFSKSSIEALMQDSSKLLKEAVEAGRVKGRDASKEALQAMCKSLEAKIADAASQGKTEAQSKFQEVLNNARAQLKKME